MGCEQHRKSSSYFKSSFKTRFGLRGFSVPPEQHDTVWTSLDRIGTYNVIPMCRAQVTVQHQDKSYVRTLWTFAEQMNGSALEIILGYDAKGADQNHHKVDNRDRGQKLPFKTPPEYSLLLTRLPIW
ncbi:hypothetical protein STEG23_024102 [Scotinomys teguina]